MARSRRDRGGNVAGALASIVGVVFAVIALIIVLGIVFTLFDANKANTIVTHVLRAARDLVGPFDGLFTPKDPKRAILVNWGLAALIYLVVGGLVSRLFRRA